jgi:hypothetical protein
MQNNYFDEKKDLLYLNDTQHKNGLLVYDLIHDQFKEPIKKSIPEFWTTFFVENDSCIIGTYYRPFKDGSNPDVLFVQNFKGDIISKIPNPKIMLFGAKKAEGFQQAGLYHFNNEFFIKFTKDDTVFMLNHNRLIPYIAFNLKNARKSPSDENIKEGDQSFAIKVITQNSILFSISTAEDVKYYSGGNVSFNRRVEYFLLNKETGHYAKIKSFTDDYIGSIQKESSEGIRIPNNLENGKIIMPLNPSEIKDILTKGSQNYNLQQSALEQLQKISNSLTETDNPVLVIGKIKI